MRVRSTQPWIRRFVGRVIAAAALALALGYVPYRVYGGEGLGRLRELRRELGELQARNEAVAAENERLRAEVYALRNDLAAIERVARDELGLVKPGEIVFQIEEP